MKNIVIGICTCVLIGLLILIVYTLHGRSIRQQELNSALTSAMRNTMERVQENRQKQIKSDVAQEDELLEVLTKEILLQIESQSEVTIHILDVDFEKGLLSAEAILKYRHPIGLEGSVSSRKTIILEQYSTASIKEECVVVYLSEGNCYKKYLLQEGSRLIVPQPPMQNEKYFIGWREMNGSELITSMDEYVHQDMTFVAVFQ